MHTEPITGWDIGGAHLKAARFTTAGQVERVVQLPCALWRGLDELRRAVDTALTSLGSTPLHALTMSGEMVDFFPSRDAGVREILAAMSDCLPHSELRVFLGDEFASCQDACAATARVASANWRATAQCVARRLPCGTLLDIGSTTTDIVPVAEGKIQARGADDAGRMMHDELVYTGIVRTPLMALAPRWPFSGGWSRVAAEYFATTADVYRITGDLDEATDQHATADGAAKTEEASAQRLARMIGRDFDAAQWSDWRTLAAWLKSEQVRTIEGAVDAVLSRGLVSRDAPIVGAGIGAFLAQQIAQHTDRPFVPFAQLIDHRIEPAWIGACAPAVAVGWLAFNG